MNFLKKRSKKLGTTFSNNNSTEENNKLNKPSQSTANPTTRSYNSSIDQASLDLLAPTPASTSLHNINKPSQSTANPTTRSDDSSIDQSSLDLLAPTPASTSLLTTCKAQHVLDKPRQPKRKVAHTAQVGEFIASSKAKAMKQRTVGI